MSKYKYMSEKRAWIWMSNASKRFDCGLCSVLEDLLYMNKISFETARRMREKIQAEADRLATRGFAKDASRYLVWDQNDEGQRQREAFARRQSTLCGGFDKKLGY